MKNTTIQLGFAKKDSFESQRLAAASPGDFWMKKP
jgi:hypothetical protein